LKGKTATNNFVIIDDEMRDISPYFDKKNLIQASGMSKEGITEEQVLTFIKGYFLNFNDFNDIYRLF